MPSKDFHSATLSSKLYVCHFLSIKLFSGENQFFAIYQIKFQAKWIFLSFYFSN